MTAEAPERKLLARNGGLPTGNYPKHELVEYVRADLHAALTAERDALREVKEASEKLAAAADSLLRVAEGSILDGICEFKALKDDLAAYRDATKDQRG